jgi:hypothetical protein
MRLTKDHLKSVQIELFYEQMNALEKEENELTEHFNIARNLACSEWEHGSIPSVSGGRQGLRVTQMLPETMKLLHKNFDQQREEISYRRYALMKAFWPIIKDRIGQNNDCYNYWETTKEVA